MTSEIFKLPVAESKTSLVNKFSFLSQANDKKFVQEKNGKTEVNSDKESNEAGDRSTSAVRPDEVKYLKGAEI